MIFYALMKNLRLLVIGVTVAALTALSATAQSPAPAAAPGKIACVDMKKLFNGYYKTKLAEDALDSHKAELRKEVKDMADGLAKSQQDYKSLLDQANDQTLSADERAKRQQAADDKAKEVANAQAALQQFQRQAEAQLADQSQRMSANLVEEIQKDVGVKAAADGYAVVVNSANPEAVVYVSPDCDITAGVLSLLNANAPADALPAAANPLVPLNLSTNLP